MSTSCLHCGFALRWYICRCRGFVSQKEDCHCLALLSHIFSFAQYLICEGGAYTPVNLDTTKRCNIIPRVLRIVSWLPKVGRHESNQEITMQANKLTNAV